ncbi:hypothetical protein LOAG_13698 [Loa loa]|uniref:Uncharacterized protein n=2 Tax=Loa loa TaxID=7209 RepID=A0A1S0TJ25_LOALO|nr:hypothetical protein LOAG_13698 [Loa loa]EFO14817.2 hypothetical protein LOAG_13698 [Loa loa]
MKIENARKRTAVTITPSNIFNILVITQMTNTRKSPTNKIVNVLISDAMRALRIAMYIENARKRTTNHSLTNTNDPIVDELSTIHRLPLTVKHINLNTNVKTVTVLQQQEQLEKMHEDVLRNISLVSQI